MVGLPALTVSMAAGPVAAAQAAGQAWAIQPVPAPPVRNGIISAVSCTAANACTAVGYFDNSAGVQMTLVERWNGSRWFVQPTPTISGAALSQLTGVSCISATICTLVGNAFFPNAAPAGKQVTLAERWNGTAWAIQTTPTLTGSSGFDSVSCPSPTMCIAVGGVTGTATLAERWNGTSWSVQTTPGGSSFSELNSVSCTSATACMAVGGAVAERWNGTSWSVQSLANSGGASFFVSSVTCTSATVCTAVGFDGGGTLAERWDGTSWKVQPTPDPGIDYNQLNGVSCPSANACTAVGVADNGTLAEVWNGTSWSVQTTPNPTGARDGVLNAVSCPSATACTAVGSTISASARVTLAEAWNGSSWSIKTTPSQAGAMPGNLNAVSCPLSNACMAVGYTNGDDWPGYLYLAPLAGMAESWNGTSWSVQSIPTPAPPGSLQQWSLDGVSCTSGTACTAVGSLLYGDQLATLAERWDGTTWAIQTTPNPNAGPFTGASYTTFDAVSCTSATACTAVGQFPNSAGTEVTLAEAWNGSSWSIQTTPNPTGATFSILTGVSCTTTTACTAVGYFKNGKGIEVPLAEVWKGTGWSIQTTSNPTGMTSSALTGVSCTATNACTAVGYAANSAGTSVTLAERWNGTSWSVQATPNPTGSKYTALVGVSCSSASACAATGGAAVAHHAAMLLERWNGTSWSIQTAPTPTGAIDTGVGAVSCTTMSSDCTAVGNTQAYVEVPFAERYS